MRLALASGFLVLAVLLAGCGGALVGSDTAPPPVAQRFAPAGPTTTSAPDAERRARLAAAYGQLDLYFEGLRNKAKAPSLAVGLVEGQDLVWSKAYGVVDLQGGAAATVDSVYRIGSITKIFTAAVAVALRDAGKVAFDVPATSYLPELGEAIYPTTDSPPVTLRHLLLHTGGMPDMGDPGTEGIGDDKHPPSDATVLGSLRGLRLLSAPGTSWSYSGVGYGLAGIALARAGGKPYRDLTTDLLVAPLHMSSTVWEPERVPRAVLTTAYEPRDDGTIAPVAPWTFGAMEPAGGLYSTVRDMARFLAWNLDAWPPRSAPETDPLSRSSRREMHRQQGFERLVTAASAPHARSEGYGLGWQSAYVCGLGLQIACTGGTEGHSAFVFALPERGVALVVLANVRDVRWRDVAPDVWGILEKAGGLEPIKAGGDPAAPGGDARCPG